MNDIQPINQSEIEVSIKEAETCYSMGMMNESVTIYERILSGLQGREGQIRETIRSKIKKIKQEIEIQEEADNKGFTEEDISIFKKTLAVHDDVPTLLDGAAALKELGLMDEAIAEYEKLLEFDYTKFDYSNFDYSPVRIMRDYLTCLLEIKQPQKAVKEAYKVIYKHNLKEKETAELKYWLGLQLEKKDQKDLAYELYETASEIDPSNKEIIDRLNSLKAKISSSSRYDTWSEIKLSPPISCRKLWPLPKK